jgi:hypothetical protein
MRTKTFFYQLYGQKFFSINFSEKKTFREKTFRANFYPSFMYGHNFILGLQRATNERIKYINVHIVNSQHNIYLQ